MPNSEELRNLLAAHETSELLRQGQALYQAYLRQPSENALPKLHGAINLYQNALAVLDRGTAPMEWALALHCLGNALRLLPGAEQKSNLETAAFCYKSALSVFNKIDSPAEWAANLTNLGVVLSSLEMAGGSTPDVDRLREAAGYLETALTARSEEKTPGPWSLSQHNLGNVYVRLAIAGDPNAARQAIAAYRAALRVRGRTNSPGPWANTIVGLATATLHLPERERAQEVPALIHHIEEAISVLMPNSSPSVLAEAHVVLARAYGIRSEYSEKATEQLEAALALMYAPELRKRRLEVEAELADALFDVQTGDRTKSCLRAITLYDDVLRNWDETSSLDRGALDINLGTCYEVVGNSESAVACYREGIRFAGEGTQTWAELQRRLGNLLSESDDSPAQAIQAAEACYRAALRVYSKETFPNEWKKIQINLGRCLARQTTRDANAGLQAAIACYREALSIIDEKSDPAAWITAHTNLGNALSRLPTGSAEDRRSAFRHYELALQAVNQRTESVTWAKLQNSIGALHRNLRAGDRAANLKSAETCFEAASSVLSKEANPNEWAQTQANLGNLYLAKATTENASEYQTAAHYYENALSVWTRERNARDWAYTVNSAGFVYANLAQNDSEARRAIELCSSAFEVLTRDDYPVDWARAQSTLASAYLHLRTGHPQENLQAALSHFGLALSVLNKTGSPFDWASAQMRSGCAYAGLLGGNRLHTLGQALHCFSEALSVYDETRTPTEWASVQANIGALHIQLEQAGVKGVSERGVKALEESLRVFRPGVNAIQWAEVQINLGTAVSKHDPERAIECYQSALRVIGPENERSLWVKTLSNLGKTYLDRSEGSDDRQRAIECFQSVLSVSTPEANLSAYSETARLLADAYYLCERWKEALEWYGKAALSANRLRTTSVDETNRLQVVRDALGVFDRGLSCAIKLEDYNRAVEFAEAGKARNLADQLRRSDYRPRGVDADDWRRYLALLSDIEAIDSHYGGAVFDEAAVVQHSVNLTSLSEMRHEATAFAKRFAADYPDYVMNEAPFTCSRIVSLARQLHAVVVEMHITSEGSCAFLVGPDDLLTSEKFVALELRADGGSTTRNSHFAGVLGAQGLAVGRGKEVATDLFAHLMGPIRRRLKQKYPEIKRLVIVPSRGLALLPLQAAWLESENGPECFVDEYEMTWVPSCVILEHCLARSSRETVGTHSLFAVQNPDRSLPFADWEVNEIEKLFPEGLCQVLRHEAASVAAVKASLSFGTEAILSCHGAFDGAKPENSHLTLADGCLTRSDLLRTDLRKVSLVVMSACTSGLIDFARLDVDEHFGLPAACLVAGAKAVVASLWKVSDVATGFLMQRFHRNLYGRGMKPARALQEAQIWLRDLEMDEAFQMLEDRQLSCSNDEEAAEAAQSMFDLRERGTKPFHDPYWWAAFQCIGLGW